MRAEIPDRLVVFTFDDGTRSNGEFVAPLLARYGFGATFYIHGVPDPLHPWVSTDPQTFRDCLSWLADGGYTVIALRDLSRYVDVTDAPAAPYSAQRRRHGTGYGPGVSSGR